MEDLVPSAEVYVNGSLAGICVVPPWRVPVKGLIGEVWLLEENRETVRIS